MLRHPSLAVALFLSASCELAGAPPPATPAAPAPAPAPAAGMSSTPSASPPSSTRAAMEGLELRINDQQALDNPRPAVMMRGGPSWGKERPRFKAKVPPPTAPKASTP